MKRNLLVRRLLSIGLLGLLVGGFSHSGKAQLTNYDWWSTSANSNFSSPSWYDGTSSTATISSGSTVGTVSFGASGTTTTVFDDLASLTASGLTLGSSGGSPSYYTVTVNAGSTLTLNNGSLSMSAASSTLVSSGSVVLNNSVVSLSASLGTIANSGAGTVTLTGANTFSSGTGQTLTVSAPLGGTGSLIKSGSGTVALTGTNTYTGGTSISAGTINFINGNAFGTGAITLGGGTLNLATTTANPTITNKLITLTGTTTSLSNSTRFNLTYSGAITGNGTIATGAGTGSTSTLFTGDLTGFTGTFLVNTINQANTGIGTTGTNSAASLNFSQGTLQMAGTSGQKLNNTAASVFQVGALTSDDGTGSLKGGLINSGTLWVGSLNTNTSANVNFNGTSASLVKVGTGTLTLTTPNSNYSATSFSAYNGTLSVALTTAGTAGTGFLAVGTVATLGGGNFSISGAQSTALTQTLSQIAVQTGSHSTFSVAQGSATSLGVTLSNATAISRGTGATVDFEISGGATLTATTAPTTSNGILSTAASTAGIAYATYGNTTWATVSGSNVTGYTGWATADYSNAANNVDVGVGNSLSGSTAVNTLRFNSSNSSLAIGSGNTLRLTDSAILVTSAATAASISGGTLGASGSSELVVINNGSLNISSTIANNAAATATALTLSGNGTTVLSNTTNTYTGATYINGGTVSIAAASSLSANTAYLNGGTILLSSGYANTSLNPSGIVLGNDGGTINTNGTNLTYSGVISGGTATNGAGDNGAASYFFVKSGSGTLTLGGSNTYAGATKILGGTLSVSSLAMEGTSGSVASNLGKSPNLAYYLVIDNGATLQYTGAVGTTDRLFTIGQSGDTGAQSGILDASGTGAIVFSNTGAIAFAGAGNRTLGLTGTNTGNNTLASTIGNASGGTTSVTKSGAGTWILTGTNTYSGGTTISGGTLSLGNTAALGATTGALSFAGGALDLAGFNATVGAIGGTSAGGSLVNSSATAAILTATSLNAGGSGTVGTLAVGVSGTGTATLNLTGATLTFDLASSSSYDKITLGSLGGVTFSGTTLLLNDLSGGTLSAGTYTLILANNTSQIANLAGLTLGTSTIDGMAATLSLDASHDLVVNLAAVPEPSTWVLLAAGCVGVAAVGRRRKAQAVA